MHAPEALEHWRGFIEAINALPVPEGGVAAPPDGEATPFRRRRRGGRRRGRRRGRFDDPSGGTSTE